MRIPILKATHARASARVLLAAALVVAMSGCERLDREQRITPRLGDRVRVVVTVDGGKQLVVQQDLRLRPGMTAMDALEAVADVRLSPDRNVERVNGYGGGRMRPLGPEPSAWFFRVDGIESNALPERFRLRPGNSLWWDLRRFDAYPVLPVAIGVFPQPFFTGYRDVQRPVRISYARGFEQEAKRFGRLYEQVEPDVDSMTERIDSKHTVSAAVRTKRANIVIGRWEQIRKDPYIADIGFDPRGFGLTVWIEGVQIRRQDPDEEFSRVLSDAEGVVWATTLDGEPDGPLVLVVTGVTDQGVHHASAALRHADLQYFIAGAVDRDGKVIP